MRKIFLISVLVVLTGCGGPISQTIDRAWDKGCGPESDEATRAAAREYGAQKGLYMKCVDPGNSWESFTLTGPGL